MAAKVWGTQQKALEEIFFQNEAVSLCLLVNRRARTMRVIDFRAGPSNAKRLFVLSLAQREGVSKVYTLVERDEVQTWQKLGFAKEGSIPGFYKRSDAFLLGCSADARVAGRAEPKDDDEVPQQSEMRLSVAGAAAPLSAAQERMERTIAAAKRGLKAAEAGPTAKITEVDATASRKAIAASLRSGRALTGFEPFGRDVERRFFVATARGGFELHASIEAQGCFGNAFLEVLESPRTDAERAGTVATIRAFCDRLTGEGVVTCFSLAPSDDVALAAAFLQNGFRRTGLLHEHIVVRGERKDAIVWSRKLANPSDE